MNTARTEKIVGRCRRVADAFDRGEAHAQDADPAVDAWLSIYREACPAVACGLRAVADAAEAGHV